MRQWGGDSSDRMGAGGGRMRSRCGAGGERGVVVGEWVAGGWRAACGVRRAACGVRRAACGCTLMGGVCGGGEAA